MPKGYYLVDKTSMLSTEKLYDYYESLEQTYKKYLAEDPTISYFGRRPSRIFRLLENVPSSMAHKHLASVFLTEERIVEVFFLRNLLLEGIKKTNIKVETGIEVERVLRESRGFSTIGKSRKAKEIIFKSDIVVNCLWNNRIKLDKTLGISTLDEPLYRFKVGILGTVDTLVPTCSITTGVYGNISPRLDKRHAYISWHKDCMKELTTDGTTPLSWEKAFDTYKTFDQNAQWIKNTLKNLIEYVPALGSFKATMLLPGIICTAGKTDIEDKSSKVHLRGSHMGVYKFENYYSVDTGKFCSAPFFANILADRITEGEN